MKKKNGWLALMALLAIAPAPKAHAIPQPVTLLTTDQCIQLAGSLRAPIGFHPLRGIRENESAFHDRCVAAYSLDGGGPWYGFMPASSAYGGGAEFRLGGASTDSACRSIRRLARVVSTNTCSSIGGSGYRGDRKEVFGVPHRRINVSLITLTTGARIEGFQSAHEQNWDIVDDCYAWMRTNDRSVSGVRSVVIADPSFAFEEEEGRGLVCEPGFRGTWPINGNNVCEILPLLTGYCHRS
jgi:hypothetical protein